MLLLLSLFWFAGIIFLQGHLDRDGTVTQSEQLTMHLDWAIHNTREQTPFYNMGYKWCLYTDWTWKCFYLSSLFPVTWRLHVWCGKIKQSQNQIKGHKLLPFSHRKDIVWYKQSGLRILRINPLGWDGESYSLFCSQRHWLSLRNNSLVVTEIE